MNSNTGFVLKPKALMILASANGFLALAFGSFAAHGLQQIAAANLVVTWHTGVRYHMFHALAALLAGLLAELCGSDVRARRWAALAGWLFIAGIVFFCGSLYLLVLAPQPWLIMMAPVGGVLFLLGWALFTGALIIRK